MVGSPFSLYGGKWWEMGASGEDRVSGSTFGTPCPSSLTLFLTFPKSEKIKPKRATGQKKEEGHPPPLPFTAGIYPI